MSICLLNLIEMSRVYNFENQKLGQLLSDEAYLTDMVLDKIGHENDDSFLEIDFSEEVLTDGTAWMVSVEGHTEEVVEQAIELLEEMDQAAENARTQYEDEIERIVEELKY